MHYEKWFSLAKYHAELFSKDPRVKVACILLSQHPHVILSTGYNGMCRGVEDVWDQPMKDHMIVHAETNAVYNAARIGVNLTNSIAVVTLFPCLSCAKALIQSGVRKVVTVKPNYDDPKWGEQFRMSKELLARTGVDVVFVENF
jgi:dCMP deaminase